MATRGRPPKFDSPKKMKAAIDNYFATSSLKSVCGLTRALGFCDRNALNDYEKKPLFSSIIKSARNRIAQHYEELGQNAKHAAFCIFILKNLGFSDRQEIETSGSTDVRVTVTIDPGLAV